MLGNSSIASSMKLGLPREQDSASHLPSLGTLHFLLKLKEILFLEPNLPQMINIIP